MHGVDGRNIPCPWPYFAIKLRFPPIGGPLGRTSTAHSPCYVEPFFGSGSCPLSLLPHCLPPPHIALLAFRRPRTAPTSTQRSHALQTLPGLACCPHPYSPDTCCPPPPPPSQTGSRLPQLLHREAMFSRPFPVLHAAPTPTHHTPAVHPPPPAFKNRLQTAPTSTQRSHALRTLPGPAWYGWREHTLPPALRCATATSTCPTTSPCCSTASCR
jgi:hypothetical protein